jgi:uncharacterized membrane protein YeaQ/YmgE (transglycosylase-associated protein family)
MMETNPFLLDYADKAYQKLLRAYPPVHRRQFGEDMAQLFRDLCREVYQQSGMAGFIGLLLTILFDLISTSVEERVKESALMSNKKILQYAFIGWVGAFVGMLLISLSYNALPENLEGATKYFVVPTPYIFGGVGGYVSAWFYERINERSTKRIWGTPQLWSFLGGLMSMLVPGVLSRFIPH